MSVLAAIRAALADSGFHDTSGFLSQTDGQPPCFNCLQQKHNYLELTCGCRLLETRCILCQCQSKKCISNALTKLGQHSDQNPFTLAPLTGLGRWRVYAAVLKTAWAWGTIAWFIKDPARARPIGDSAAIDMQIQELAALREIITTDLLFKVGKITDRDEVIARINASRPLYTRDHDHAAISGLVTSLRCLSTSANTRDPKAAEEGTLLDFYPCLTLATIMEVRESLGKPAPSRVISYSGKAPVRRGPSDNNTLRTSKLTAATRDSAAIHPVSKPCLPSAKLFTKRTLKEPVASRKKPRVTERVSPRDSDFYDSLDLPLDSLLEDEDYVDIWGVEKTTKREPNRTRSAHPLGGLQRSFSINSSAELPQTLSLIDRR
ncbi:hypothetical protein BGZ61DRAFT_527114 [Ilyonectria robusta]|uniref:uncharacterized protein n=1 Tax=Ilyonectria robusta TaxID=1079257 RepID=UPI001E8CE994|nr:uncharacterized protein BGZ61DRAFT_527114 [Ilyonectria robusta]KAH8736126.1 hypothetical protein BGZ61DRAFT_527114 [Ilyonectria robusta]